MISHNLKIFHFIRNLNDDVFQQAIDVLIHELVAIGGHHGDTKFRITLTCSFLYKMFLEIKQAKQVAMSYRVLWIHHYSQFTNFRRFHGEYQSTKLRNQRIFVPIYMH